MKKFGCKAAKNKTKHNKRNKKKNWAKNTIKKRTKKIIAFRIAYFWKKKKKTYFA